MALIDHFLPESGPVTEGGNGFNRISAHNFTGGLFLWAASPEVSRANVVAAFNLDAIDEVQLDQMAAVYAALATLAEKNQYVATIHHSLMLSSTGVLTKAKTMTILGLT